MHTAQIVFYYASPEEVDEESTTHQSIEEAIHHVEHEVAGRAPSRAWVDGKELLIRNGKVITEPRYLDVVLIQDYLGEPVGTVKSVLEQDAVQGYIGGVWDFHRPTLRPVLTNPATTPKFCKDCVHCIVSKSGDGEHRCGVSPREPNLVTGDSPGFFFCSTERKGHLSTDCGPDGIKFERKPVGRDY